MAICYYMTWHRVTKNTYDKEQDTFRVVFIIVPCLILSLLINQNKPNEFSFIEVSP